MEGYMEILSGSLYFISNSFFKKIKDPFLKKNYDKTKRPHYFAFQDQDTNLYWMVPCSSKVEKFQKIIEKKRGQGKRTDSIQIIKIENKESVLLFQDMFPVRRKYIDGQYFRQNHNVKITNPKLVAKLEKTAKKIRRMILNGIKFTPTQPNINKIEQLMIDEEKQSGCSL